MQVVRSGDFLSYTAEEGVRFLGQGELLTSDSFPGQDRNKLGLVQKVQTLSPVAIRETCHWVALLTTVCLILSNPVLMCRILS